ISAVPGLHSETTPGMSSPRPPASGISAPESGRSAIGVSKSATSSSGISVAGTTSGTPASGIATSGNSTAMPASGAATSGIPASASPTPAIDDDPASTRAALRARWEALADSINDAEELDDSMIESIEEPEPLPPVAAKSVANAEVGAAARHQPWTPGTTDDLAG